MRKLFLLSILYLSLSCQQEEFLKEQQLFKNEPKVVKNRLSFNSKEELNQFIDNSKKAEFEYLKERISEFEKQGFVSLLPTFKHTDTERVAEYVAKHSSVNPNARELIAIDAEDDPIISDPYFAILLNDEREIIVEDNIYKFTDYGLLYTSVDNYDELLSYSKQISDCQLALADGTTYLGGNVYGFIPEPIYGICDYGMDWDNDNYTYSTASTSSMTKEDFMDQMKTCDYQENVLNKIFGPSEKCIDKWSSDRRIKTKTWNQNYLIYTSVGLKTKTQKRISGIWWASESDELELGYEVVKYRFDGVDVSKILTEVRNNSLGLNYVYEYNGYLLNQYGIISSNNYWGSGANLFDKWPINDPNSRVLKIYIGGPIQDFLDKIDKDLLSIDGKDVNKQVKNLAKQGWSAVTKYLKATSQNGGAVIVGGNPYSNRFYFVYTDWYSNKKNENKIREIFDFNTAQIGFTYNPGSGSTSPTYSPSKSYKEFAISCYGIGRRGSEWRGGRIVLVQK
jgi:hypothetical protein